MHKNTTAVELCCINFSKNYRTTHDILPRFNYNTVSHTPTLYHIPQRPNTLLEHFALFHHMENPK